MNNCLKCGMIINDDNATCNKCTVNLVESNLQNNKSEKTGKILILISAIWLTIVFSLRFIAGYLNYLPPSYIMLIFIILVWIGYKKSMTGNKNWKIYSLIQSIFCFDILGIIGYILMLITHKKSIKKI